MEILSHENVQEYKSTKKFADAQLPVLTAMCDNFKGWGNFSFNEFGIHSNVCLPHATGTVPIYIFFESC
jgi:hypothetical protein